MTIRCPVCRADNEAPAAGCRRCKADLAPLVLLETARAHALAQAAAAATTDAVLEHARQAHALRPDRDSARWLAVGHLLRHDFARALANWSASA